MIDNGMLNEEQLKAEIVALRSKVAEQERELAIAKDGHGKPAHHKVRKPTRGVLIFLSLAAIVAMVVAFFTGYMPLQERQTQLVASAKEDTSQDLLVNVYKVDKASGQSQVGSPGTELEFAL